MIKSPQDLGLPFTSWRPRQDEMVQEVLDLNSGDVLILEAPCGYGKSGVAGATSYYRPGTTVTMHSRDLQAQYCEQLDGVFRAVWGRAHYPCTDPDHIADFTHVYGEPPTREDCHLRKPSECEYECPYRDAVVDALSARARTFNLHYAFHSRWWRPHCADLFCDEAHRLPVVLSDLVSIEMTESLRRRLTLPPFPLAPVSSPHSIKQVRHWIDKCSSPLTALSKSKDIKAKRSAERWKSRLETLASVISLDGEWYVTSKPGEGLLAKPVIPGAFSSSILVPEARSYVLMSATIGDPSVLASELGIENYTFRTYPHIFPPENRPVIFYQDSPKLSYRSTESEYRYQIELIQGIMAEHKGEKGIIHTASWSHAKRLAAALEGNGRRIILPEPRERVRSIERFKRSGDGTVAISPSWKEGLDFAGDLARWCAIVKLPWPSLADPIVKLRIRRKGGKNWMDWVTALSVVQAAGRIVRSPEDWGVTYILDGHWPRVARKAPKWFEWERR